MATYLITAPDGRKFRVSGDGSKEEALAHFQSQYKPQAEPEPAPDPSEGGGTLRVGPWDTGIKTSQGVDRFLSGAGKAFSDVGRGLGQLNDTIGARAGGILPIPGMPMHAGLPAEAREAQLQQRASQEAEIAERDAPLMATGAGKGGNLTGNIASAIPTAFVPGVNTYTGAALTGAGLGLMQPTATPEQGATNTAIGAGLGLGGQYVGNKVGGWAQRKLAERAARAATQQSQNSVRDATLREALDAGYSVPPATTNPSAKNAALESVAGKAATQSLASSKNQQVTNRLIRQDLGLADDVPLTPEALKTVRTQAGTVYRAIEESGDIVADQKYLDDIVDLVGGNNEISKSFPGAKVTADKEVLDLADTLLQEKFTAKAAVEYAKRLRSQAKTNFKSAYASGGNAEKLELARAQWDAAGAIEDAIGRNLAQQGRGQLAEQFQQARVLIAKSHSAEAALNEGTGNIVASRLVNQLRRGKPMTGGFEKVAKFASLAPKATAEPTQSGGVSALSAAIAAGGLGMGQPGLLAIPAGRVLTKHAILSRAMQRRMALPNYTPGRTGTALLQGGQGLGRIAAPAASSIYATEQ